jgi:hypothetical protein
VRGSHGRFLAGLLFERVPPEGGEGDGRVVRWKMLESVSSNYIRVDNHIVEEIYV